MTRRSNRREFLATTALAGVGYWAAGGVALAQSKSANEKLNVGFVGAGGRASGNLKGLAGTDVNIVALCDVDEQRAANAFKQHPQARKYTDFRKMLEQQKDLDAVVVSTPDHTHAFAAVAAMQLGKHVYCEKPLTHSVYEARVMRETAARCKVATQMGNQGTASDGLRTGVEVIRSGAIGPVREVHIWTNRPIWPQGIDRPREAQPVPPTLAWDLWLGPAPERPYNKAYVPFAWRGWWDFGTGALGDMGCHTANLPFMALKLKYPTSVVAESSPVHPETYPTWAIVRYEFPARGDQPPVRVTWYEGHRDGQRVLPPSELLQGQAVERSGSLLVGDKGTLYSGGDNGSSYKLLPLKEFEGYKPPSPSLPRSPGHHKEWVQACKGGPPALSNFVDYAGYLTEFILLGNVAIRAGKQLAWDGDKMQVTNCPEAAAFIRREYRKGWSL